MALALVTAVIFEILCVTHINWLMDSFRRRIGGLARSVSATPTTGIPVTDAPIRQGKIRLICKFKSPLCSVIDLPEARTKVGGIPSTNFYLEDLRSTVQLIAYIIIFPRRHPWLLTPPWIFPLLISIWFMKYVLLYYTLYDVFFNFRFGLVSQWVWHE